MPEPASPATPQPVDTEDLIRKSIAGVGDSDEPLVDDENAIVDEPAVVDPPAESVAAVVPEPVVPEPAAAAVEKPEAAAAAAAAAAKANDELDISKVPARGANGRVNAIPQPRVVKMVEKSVEKAKGEWTDKVLKPVQAKVDVYETRLHSIASTEDLMFGMRGGKPLPEAESVAAKKQFLSQLVSAIPGYAELLRGASFAAGDGKTVAPEAVVTRGAADDPEPKPDVIENGMPVGYSEKGLADLRAWDRRAAARDAVAQAKDALVKEFGLDRISGKFKEVETRQQSLSAIESEINTASASWRGFNENATAILAALEGNRDPSFGLRQAYEEVLFGLASRKATDEKTLEETLRTRITQQLATAPRSTSAGSGTLSTRAAEDVPTSGDAVEDAIRRSIRGLR